MQTFFITGTDTDAGKTVATQLILQELNKVNRATLGIKPISAGCELSAEGLRNTDALILQAASGIEAKYEIINPIAYAEAIAPHIAAAICGESIELDDLQNCLQHAQNLNPRWLLIEGAGGWRLPLNNEGLYFSDFAIQNRMQVILVVGMQLGCINHAVLSYQAIVNDGLECVGWVANKIDQNMPFYQENLATLCALLPCPMLAEIPYQTAPFNTIVCTQDFLQVFA